MRLKKQPWDVEVKRFIIWMITFMLIPVGFAWLNGYPLWFFALCGVFFGSAFSLMLRQVTFRKIFLTCVKTILYYVPGFIVGSVIGFIFGYFLLWGATMESVRLFAIFFATLFGAIHVLVFAFKSIELIEKLDRVYYWIIAGMIYGPIIGKVVGATVILGKVEVAGAAYGLPFGALVGVVFCMLHAQVGWRKILQGLCLFFAIHLVVLFYSITVVEWFDYGDGFLMVVAISTVWLLPFTPYPILYDYTNVRVGSLILLFIWMIFFSFYNTVVISGFSQEYKFHEALKKEGIWTSATIYECKINYDRSDYMKYEYDVVGPDDQIQRYRNGESISSCKKLGNNSQIDIQYLPQDPNQATWRSNKNLYRGLGGVNVLYLLAFVMFFPIQIMLGESEKPRPTIPATIKTKKAPSVLNLERATMQVQDSQGTVIELGQAIKRGGEAKIFEVKKKPNLVAKIYHAHRAEREAKLKAMLAKVPVLKAHTALAWPIELLYKQGRLVGFLMPKISGYDPIIRFYNPMLRKKQFASFNWRYLHRAATNLAVVVETVHLTGHLICDLNESNILLNDQALVTLVDTDSFQIVGTQGQIYRSVVGKPEYTPPELQKARFKEVDRRPEHDHFALAVLIFQLLMEGYHPFSGVLPAHLSVERTDVYAIKKGLFAYRQNRKHRKQLRIHKPPNAPPFTLLHPDLQALFIRCFVDGYYNPIERPTAREWRAHLEKAEEALVTCRRDQTHIYGTHLATCPFCPPEPAGQKPLHGTNHTSLNSLFSVIPNLWAGPSAKRFFTLFRMTKKSGGQFVPFGQKPLPPANKDRRPPI